MLPNQIRQQIGSLALVSGLAGLLLTFTRQGFPMAPQDVGPWLVVVLVWAVLLFLASGLLPFVWFAATRFRPRSACGGLMLWWLMLVLLAGAVYYTGFELA